jgi:hypothetical protein
MRGTPAVFGCFNAAASSGSLRKALAGCREDRVGDRGNDGRRSGFAHSARRLGALDDVDLDGGRLVDAQLIW